MQRRSVQIYSVILFWWHNCSCRWALPFEVNFLSQPPVHGKFRFPSPWCCFEWVLALLSDAKVMPQPSGQVTLALPCTECAWSFAVCFSVKCFPAALTGNPVLVVSNANMPRCLAFVWKHLATAFRAKGFLTNPTVNRFGMGQSGRFLSKALTAAVGTREPSSTMGGFGMFCSITLRAVYLATTLRASKRLGRRPPLIIGCGHEWLPWSIFNFSWRGVILQCPGAFQQPGYLTEANMCCNGQALISCEKMYGQRFIWKFRWRCWRFRHYFSVQIGYNPGSGQNPVTYVSKILNFISAFSFPFDLARNFRIPMSSCILRCPRLL